MDTIKKTAKYVYLERDRYADEAHRWTTDTVEWKVRFERAAYDAWEAENEALDEYDQIDIFDQINSYLYDGDLPRAELLAKTAYAAMLYTLEVGKRGWNWKPYGPMSRCGRTCYLASYR